MHEADKLNNNESDIYHHHSITMPLDHFECTHYGILAVSLFYTYGTVSLSKSNIFLSLLQLIMKCKENSRIDSLP